MILDKRQTTIHVIILLPKHHSVRKNGDWQSSHPYPERYIVEDRLTMEDWLNGSGKS